MPAARDIWQARTSQAKTHACRTLFEFQKLLGKEKQAAVNWQ
jgi:hypothetical protein